ncbi:MAG: hypothetical protein ACI37S_03965 [Candidatus Gastranaerophilaceae bacterium]
MKKLFFTLFSILFFISSANAEKMEFNGEVYNLQYSTKTDVGYVNEYIRNFEHTDDWNKILIITYYNNTDDAAEYMDKYAKQIKMLPNYTFQSYDEIKKILAFNTNYFNSDYFDFNIMKFKKHNDKGIIGMQYIQKYYYSNERDIATQLVRAKAIGEKIIKVFDEKPIPEIIQKEIDIF